MQFVRGTAVLTAAGKEVGRVDRVVLRPETKDVTHIVVRKGPLLGLDSGVAKVLPVDLIASAGAQHVSLKPDAANLEDLPDFQETQYLVVDEQELKQTGGQATPSVQTVYSSPVYTPDPVIFSPEPAYVKETKENIPEGTVALKEGAKVVTAEGKHIGNVERVLADSNDKATHLVISKGILLKTRKLLPVAWVQEVEEDQVRLTVAAHSLDDLEDYDGEAVNSAKLT